MSIGILIDLAPALAALTSGIAAAYSAYKLRSKVKAEKHFVNKLKESKSLLNKEEVNNLYSIRNKVLHNIHVESEDLSKAASLLEKYIIQLEEADKDYINQAVHQESLKGRLRYIDKIISKLDIEPSDEYNKERQADA